MTRYLNDSYLEDRRTQTKLQLQLVKKDFSQDGGCLGGFVVWTMLTFCLCPDMITEWSRLCLTLRGLA